MTLVREAMKDHGSQAQGGRTPSAKVPAVSLRVELFQKALFYV